MNKPDRLEDLKEMIDQAFPDLDLTPAQKQALRQRAQEYKAPKSKKRWWFMAAVPVVAAAIVCAVVIPQQDFGAEWFGGRQYEQIVDSVPPETVGEMSPGPGTGEQKTSSSLEAANHSGMETSSRTQDVSESQKSEMSASPQGHFPEATGSGKSVDYQQAMRDFSWEFFKESVAADENTICSPESAACALGLTADSMPVDTRSEFVTVLGGGQLSPEELDEGYRSWARRTSQETEITLENKVSVPAGAQGIRADTLSEMSLERSMEKLFQIVEKTGSGTQVDVVQEVSVSLDWQESMDASETVAMEFRTAGGPVTADFLSGKAAFLQSGNAKGIKKAYRNSNYSFVAVVPDEGISLPEYVSSMDGEQFSKLVQGQSGTVEYQLPKFQVSAERALGQTLKAMGLTKIFEKSGKEDLTFGRVVQKASLTIDESGTHSTSKSRDKQSLTTQKTDSALSFDRPFLYAVIENESGLPLLLGTVSNPQI